VRLFRRQPEPDERVAAVLRRISASNAALRTRRARLRKLLDDPSLPPGRRKSVEKSLSHIEAHRDDLAAIRGILRGEQ